MQEITTVKELRAVLEERRRSGASIGFVPTMGALHEGHLALMRRARAENDVSVVSIFVNPLQFGANEDLDKYPRMLDHDRKGADMEGVDFLFVPSVDEMYPGGAIKTTVTVKDLTRYMEGALRPGHFDGVATVVNKLFSIVSPTRAYFGEKDWQQLAVIQRMVSDLSMAVEVVGCETVREPDGLAMSSRNSYLEPEARESATRIPKALFEAQAKIAGGERSAAVITDFLTSEITFHNVIVNYADAVDENMKSVMTIDGDTRLCVSVGVWGTVLIDNVGVTL
jgi:pantoate--beta-alanine ligase